MSVKKMLTTVMATCLIAICSWISIPFAVPFTLQTFAVFFAVLFLGGRYASLSIAVYLVLGIAGVPVFSGFGGGMGYLLGPTGGYLIGFLLISAMYAVFENKAGESRIKKAAVLSAGLVLCYAAGTVWFMTVYNGYDGRNALSVIALCVLPYIVPDALKMTLAIYADKYVKKAVSRQ